MDNKKVSGRSSLNPFRMLGLLSASKQLAAAEQEKKKSSTNTSKTNETSNHVAIPDNTSHENTRAPSPKPLSKRDRRMSMPPTYTPPLENLTPTSSPSPTTHPSALLTEGHALVPSPRLMSTAQQDITASRSTPTSPSNSASPHDSAHTPPPLSLSPPSNISPLAALKLVGKSPDGLPQPLDVAVVQKPPSYKVPQPTDLQAPTSGPPTRPSSSRNVPDVTSAEPLDDAFLELPMVAPVPYAASKPNKLSVHPSGKTFLDLQELVPINVISQLASVPGAMGPPAGWGLPAPLFKAGSLTTLLEEESNSAKAKNGIKGRMSWGKEKMTALLRRSKKEHGSPGSHEATASSSVPAITASSPSRSKSHSVGSEAATKSSPLQLPPPVITRPRQSAKNSKDSTTTSLEDIIADATRTAFFDLQKKLCALQVENITLSHDNKVAVEKLAENAKTIASLTQDNKSLKAAAASLRTERDELGMQLSWATHRLKMQSNNRRRGDEEASMGLRSKSSWSFKREEKNVDAVAKPDPQPPKQAFADEMQLAKMKAEIERLTRSLNEAHSELQREQTEKLNLEKEKRVLTDQIDQLKSYFVEDEAKAQSKRPTMPIEICQNQWKIERYLELEQLNKSKGTVTIKDLKLALPNALAKIPSKLRRQIADEVEQLMRVMTAAKLTTKVQLFVLVTLADAVIEPPLIHELTHITNAMVGDQVHVFETPESILKVCQRTAKVDGVSFQEALLGKLVAMRAKRTNKPLSVAQKTILSYVPEYHYDDDDGDDDDGDEDDGDGDGDGSGDREGSGEDRGDGFVEEGDSTVKNVPR